MSNPYQWSGADDRFLLHLRDQDVPLSAMCLEFPSRTRESILKRLAALGKPIGRKPMAEIEPWDPGEHKAFVESTAKSSADLLRALQSAHAEPPADVVVTKDQPRLFSRTTLRSFGEGPAALCADA